MERGDLWTLAAILIAFALVAMIGAAVLTCPTLGLPIGLAIRCIFWPVRFCCDRATDAFLKS